MPQARPLLKWNGTSTTPQTSGPMNNLYGMWGTDAKNFWVVGDTGTILKWNGTSFTPQISGTTNPLLGLFGIDVNTIWAVGVGGTIAWTN
jgi:hypothetical protein